MPVVVNATPKATNANAYCTLAQANAYWEVNAYSEVWNAASDEQKNAAIVHSTQILDSLDWVGNKTTIEQALRWPRAGLYDPDRNFLDDDLIPANIAKGAAQMAGELLAENRTADQGTTAFSSVRVGSIGVVYDKQAERRLIPRSVNDLIKWWLMPTNTVPLVRT